MCLLGDLCLFSSLVLWHFCGVRDGGILGCGSQVSHPSHSHCIPSLCPIMPTSAMRASHCRPYITSHCPECHASLSPHPWPLGRYGQYLLYTRGWSPGKAKIWASVSSPTFHESNQCASHKEPYDLVWFAPLLLHYFLSWMGTSVCLPGDDLGPLLFLLLKWLPPRPDSLC